MLTSDQHCFLENQFQKFVLRCNEHDLLCFLEIKQIFDNDAQLSRDTQGKVRRRTIRPVLDIIDRLTAYAHPFGQLCLCDTGVLADIAQPGYYSLDFTHAQIYR